jgi:hypothetical protein
MKLLLLNLLVVFLVALPLLILETGRHHSEWLERNHEGLGVIVWLVTLFVIYVWVLPRLGLVPNWRFFER